MGMKAVLESDARGSQHLADPNLQPGQLRQVCAADAGPQHLGTAHVRKGPDSCRRQSKSAMCRDDGSDLRLKILDRLNWKMPKEMQREVDPLHIIDANPVVKRLQPFDRRL